MIYSGSFPGALEKNVYSAVLDEMACRYQFSPVGLMCHLRSLFSHWFFCLDDLFIGISELLKSILLLHFLPICLLITCFIYLGAPVIGTYMLINDISACCANSFVIIQCPSLSFIVHFKMPFKMLLKSTLSAKGIATPTFLSLPFAWNLFSTLTFGLCVFSSELSLLQAASRFFFFFLSNQPPCGFWLRYWYLIAFKSNC